MHPRTLLLTGLLAVAGLAGCLSDDDPDSTGNLAGTTGRLLAGASIWDDPQNTPHPAYGWPTLSSPAEDATGWHAPMQGAGLPDAIGGLEHVTSVDGVTSGAGIAAYGSLVVVPGYGANTTLVDISDPTDPVVLSEFASQSANHRGATIIAYPDGRIVTAISTSDIIDVWDITDPTDPQPLPYLEPGSGSHTVGVVPGTPIVYNAASGGRRRPDR